MVQNKKIIQCPFNHFFLLHRPKEGMDFVQSYITHHVTYYHYYDKEIKAKLKNKNQIN